MRRLIKFLFVSLAIIIILSGISDIAPLLLNNKYIEDIYSIFIEDEDKDFDVIIQGLGQNEEIKIEPKSGEAPREIVTEDVPEISSVLRNAKDIQKVIKDETKSFNDNFTLKVSPSISNDEIQDIVDSLYNDGTYMSGVLGRAKYNIRESSIKKEITVDIGYNITKEQEDYVNESVKQIIGKIIKADMTEFEKVKVVHDFIVNNTVYSTEASTSIHSPYTLLREGRGVCQAYALVNSKFLDVLGIENYYITGQANTGNGWEGHAWNLVNLDGRYYNIDVTWDDPVTSDGSDVLRYDYFLISDEKIDKDHIRDSGNFPKAIDKRYE